MTQEDFQKLIKWKDLESLLSNWDDLNSICAIDPGVRTFLTIYTRKEVIEFGIAHEGKVKVRKVSNPPPWKRNAPGRKETQVATDPTSISGADASQSPKNLLAKNLKPLKGPLMMNAFRIRQMQSMVAKAKNLKPGDVGYLSSKQRAEYERRMRLLRARNRHIRDDAHYKIIKYLVDNLKVVFIPKLPVQEMIKRKGRRLSKVTVGKMLDWGHALFLKRLLDKAKNTACSVIIVNESYTSKTCSSCGKINELQGSKKEFNCPRCPARMDRDANGSKNIMVRSIASFLEFIFEEDALHL